MAYNRANGRWNLGPSKKVYFAEYSFHRSRYTTDMKILLNSIAALGATLLLASCTDYDYYNSGAGYGSTSGYSTVHVGIIRTSNSYWGYDPYRRCYYDYRSSRYYNPYTRSYYTTTPRCYTKPSYPTGYRSGRALALPSALNRVHYKNYRTMNPSRLSNTSQPTSHGKPHQSKRSYSIPSQPARSHYGSPKPSSRYSTPQKNTHKSRTTSQPSSVRQHASRTSRAGQITRGAKPKTITGKRQTATPRSIPSPSAQRPSSPRKQTPTKSTRKRTPSTSPPAWLVKHS